MSCKTLKDCPSLLTLKIDEKDPNNIFDNLTPCKVRNGQQDLTYVCIEDLKTRFDELETEMPNCQCTSLAQCPTLMEDFVAVQNWTGLAQMRFCGFADTTRNALPKYCC